MPISSAIKNTDRLEKNISDAITASFQLVLVIDRNTESPNDFLEKLCERASQKSSLVKIVRGKFGAPGTARNAGIIESRSEFITFWDSDDEVNVPNIKKTLNTFGHSFDFIVGSYETFDSIGVSKRYKNASRAFPRLNLIYEPAVWRILFRVSKINQSTFGSTKMAEDQVFLIRSGIFNSKLVYFSPTKFYLYFTNLPDQLTSGSELNLDLRISFMEILRSNVKAKYFKEYFKFLMLLRLALTILRRYLKGLK
jgi:glycosyltransferase involved in cell wall biosynthesis